MKFSHISIGAGITGIETILALTKEVDRRKKKISPKFLIGIIDKNPENISGGVGYGFKISKYGFFNNPIRLSPKPFRKWLSDKKIKEKIIHYLKIHGGLTGNHWIKKNKDKLFSKNIKEFNELYIPRATLNIWMEERLILLIKKIKENKSNFDIKFFKGEVISFKDNKDKLKKIFFKNNFCKELKYKLNNDPFKKLSFKEGKNYKSIISLNQSIGLGLPPPKQLATKKAQENNNYIWDFYAQGSTSLLIDKILKFPRGRKIIVYFIGYKAGLLESLPELEKIIKKNNIKIQLICSSRDLISIQKATLTNYKKSYKLSFLKKNKLAKITGARILYESILKEFQNSLKNGYNKYDAWTEILKNNILDKCIAKFKKKEKEIYHKVYHSKIRNITRFTYPETIKARELLSKNNILITNKEIVKKVDIHTKKLIVKTIDHKNTNKKYICDIVVNVSGPLNVENIKNEIPLIKSLKSNGAKVSSGGFLVNNNFAIRGIKNTYTPSILATGFNPQRKTIFTAILRNSFLVGNNIAKNLLKV